MGFGYGRTTTHNSDATYYETGKRAPKTFSNAMVAHVWNSQKQTFGQSSNGNIYFHDRALYSYGTHYMVGYIMPDGVAILNAFHHGVSTSGHQSDARRATTNRIRYMSADLTDLARIIERVSDYMNGDKCDKPALRNSVVQAMRAHAPLMSGHKLLPGEYSGDDSLGTLGSYLAACVGLTPASWLKAERAHAKAVAKEEADKAKRKAVKALSHAVMFADRSDLDFRKSISASGGQYGRGQSFLKQEATEYNRARKVGKANGFSKKRMAKLWEREKTIRQRLEHGDIIDALQYRRRNLHALINWAKECKDMPAEMIAEWSSNTLRTARANLQSLSVCMRFPPASRAKFLAMEQRAADQLANTIIKENEAREAARIERDRQDAIDKAERAERDADAIASWKAGESVRPPSFDAPEGGAEMRVKDGLLQTSWGADVPLEHAVKVFRFVKLCRDNGQSWHRNGKTIRVGHFQVDRIDANGDFTAGCHSFKWEAVERVAKIAGLFDLAASAEALEVTA